MTALPVVPEKGVAEFRDELDEMFGKHNKYRKSSKQLMERLCPLSSTPVPISAALSPSSSSRPAELVLSIPNEIDSPAFSSSRAHSPDSPHIIEISDDEIVHSTRPVRERSHSDESPNARKPTWKQKLSIKFWSSGSSNSARSSEYASSGGDLNITHFVDKEREKEALEILFTRYSYGGTMMKCTNSSAIVSPILNASSSSSAGAATPKGKKSARRRKSSSDSSVLFVDELKDLSMDGGVPSLPKGNNRTRRTSRH
eukprot:TRINITY_DN2937_c0_g1_i1.p1 TRINITY_DN2937_c0_g1~~TRINITY_DN2937_c0_g1_i1.p1  ORF type:complete len:256 (+),score=58.62 TRINITY_DN2937_c0_g1_i1:301-1068(+)